MNLDSTLAVTKTCPKDGVPLSLLMGWVVVPTCAAAGQAGHPKGRSGAEVGGTDRLFYEITRSTQAVSLTL